MSTTGNNEFRSVTPENVWHVLRAVYGKQMHAASVSVLLIRDDGVMKFETISLPTRTSIDADVAQERQP